MATAIVSTGERDFQNAIPLFSPSVPQNPDLSRLSPFLYLTSFHELIPGKDVVWLEVPFSAMPGEQKGLDTTLPNGKNYGFVVNKQQIVANKAWTDANPAAAKLFEIMRLPLADINAQNHLMSQGENKDADVQRHVDG